ncbi:hypothetical protein OBCHQ24_03900 [Oceanobacillus iheyensis]|nr:hypothetical protein OBCHQ24_03900 [Oceanobacillus iheyensis]
MPQYKKPEKPVILLNIDSLMSYPLEVAVQTGRAPALKFLMENGTYFPEMVSSYPTMSVTIDSSLLTGTYPDQHRIPGLNWFDTNKRQFVNYGTGVRETFRIGMRKSIHNMLYRLNNEHMSTGVTTIYEDLAKEGVSSASINSFVYRGNTPKRLKAPLLLRRLTRFEKGTWISQTTPVFSLGVFSKIRRWGFPTQLAAGNHKFTARELRHLIRTNRLPGFTFCIFQDLDARIHFRGPMDIKGITKIDREIQKTLNLYSSWEDALKKNIWLVIGDNGHAPSGMSYKQVVIDLRKSLHNYRIAKIQQPVHKKDQLVFSVNQRMAYIYVLDEKLPLSPLIEPLKADKRIDVIAWKDQNHIHVESGIVEGRITFSPGGSTQDIYGQSWHIEGDLEVLDLKRTDGDRLAFGKFPDALSRLYGALHSQSGRFIVVNAKPGCEFKAQSTPFHLAGAAHGSLHKQESLVPLIIAGSTDKPIYPRFVDLKAFIFQQIMNQFHSKKDDPKL